MANERMNLMNMAKLSIKGLIESALNLGRTLDSDYAPLQQFFVVMEHCLKHGLKGKFTWEEPSWPVCHSTGAGERSSFKSLAWCSAEVEQGVCDHRWLDRAQEKEEISWRCNAAGEKLHCCSCLSLLKQPFGCDSSITKSSGLKLPPQQTHDSIFSALPQRGNASLAGRGSATLCSSIEIEDFYLVQLISFKLLF